MHSSLLTAIFSPDSVARAQAQSAIYADARNAGIYPASIHELYMAMGRGEVQGFTVPAFNIRMMTYDTACTFFTLAMEKKIGAFLFEIARSEMSYTDQSPREYSTALLAAALDAGYTGPIFIQGDHFQFSPSGYASDPAGEEAKIKKLIADSIAAHFYNIDIDASTLVDLSKLDLDAQQKVNYIKTAELTTYIRSLQPHGVTISVGGEIGHIGGKNSTVAEFNAFMQGYTQTLPRGIQGMSKVSVQTGTSHGGVPLPDGGVADVALDFDVLRSIGTVARERYHIGGPVQHGASTLPVPVFDAFPAAGAIEIHLATGFQNIVYDAMPEALRSEMYAWVTEHAKSEFKEKNTLTQNLYSTRKKAIGPFKQKLWNLSATEKAPILTALRAQFEILCIKLGVYNTRDTVARYVKDVSPITVNTLGEHFVTEVVHDLSD